MRVRVKMREKERGREKKRERRERESVPPLCCPVVSTFIGGGSRDIAANAWGASFELASA